MKTTNTVNLNDYPLFTALVTPLNDDGSVDYLSFDYLVKRQSDAGVGIVLLGSTGEGLALTQTEQQNVVDYVCALAPEVPILVAVGGYNLNAQLAWIEQCNQCSIDGYLLGAPLYAKPGRVGQQAWFEALLNKAKYPCMLYNVPSRSGVNLSFDALAAIEGHPNFWALKEASGDVETFAHYSMTCPSVKIYSGEDGLMPELAAVGAAGLVSVCANVWPEATLAYVRNALSGIAESSSVWKKATNSLFSVANPVPIKVLMHQQKQLKSPVLRAPLTHQELTCSANVLQANEQINLWHKSQLTNEI